MVVPSSGLGEASRRKEGLDKSDPKPASDWRRASCSMYSSEPGQTRPSERCASTSNHNFEGRQGRSRRTIW